MATLSDQPALRSNDLIATVEQNFQIAKRLQELTTLLAFQGEAKAKLRTYEKAIHSLKSSLTPIPILIQNKELTKLPFIGPAIAKKITDIVLNNPESKYNQLLNLYGTEFLHILQYSGLSINFLQKLYAVKPFQTLPELKELLFSLSENQIKGIGPKTLQKAQQQLLLYEQNRTKWLYHHAIRFYETQIEPLLSSLTPSQFSLVGKSLTASPVIDALEILIAPPLSPQSLQTLTSQLHLHTLFQNQASATFQTPDFKHIRLHFAHPKNFEKKLIQLSFHPNYWKNHNFSTIQELLAFHNLPDDLSPELYDLYPLPPTSLSQLPTLNDIKGILHIHTLFSDGYHSLETLLQFATSSNFQFLGITDHSSSAFYANGLSPKQVQEQWQQIDQLNSQSPRTRLLKGIECDVLQDGSLDYDDAFRAQFDFIIASIHSHLNMNEEEATQRWLHAIQKSPIHIIGHISGRLLLSRPGYPLHYETIFQACHENQVAIEFNTNPHRMDIDWQLIPKATQYGIPILLAPDAHSLIDFTYIETGIRFLRKALLPKSLLLNSWDLDALFAFFRKKA